MAHNTTPETAFLRLYGQAPRAFWLDSARAEPGLARFSFMGSPSSATGGPGEALYYRIGDGHVRVHQNGRLRLEPGTIFEALERRLLQAPIAGAEALPFDLWGGYVGYFGYELKAHLGGDLVHHSDFPDALWLEACRFIAFDHETNLAHLVTLSHPSGEGQAQKWYL